MEFRRVLFRSGWWSRAIANHYCDEFSESHGKFLTVREAMGASTPSAGVACAFERQILERLVNPATGGPFDQASLTGDYEDRQRVVEGTSGSVRGAPGGLRVSKSTNDNGN